MDRKITALFALICTFLLLSALIFASIRIGGEARDNKNRAHEEFVSLARTLQTRTSLSIDDEAFRQAVRDAFFASPTLVAILLESPSGPELALEKAPGYLEYERGFPSFKEGLALDSTSLSAPLPLKGTMDSTLRALAIRFEADRMANILKQALLILAASVLMALVLLISSNALKRDGGKRATGPVAAVRSCGPEPLPLDEHLPGLDPELSTESGSQGQDEVSVPASLQGRIDDLEPEAIPPRGDSPCGLYNPETGAGWEDYLMERLSAELHRSASFEQDLVLILIDSPGEHGSELLAPLASKAIKFFSFRDLTFEYGRGGLAVILPNMDLDHGLRMAEEFIQRMQKETERGEGPQRDVRCGVASRHGRLLEAERLLAEARGALTRANEDASAAVIAFRSDPERYREFVKKP